MIKLHNIITIQTT